jgi:membrane fusion protein (multidrug efflux system)
MAIAFSRSLRALESERRTLGLLLALLATLGILGLGLWLSLAKLPLYALSSAARIVQQRGGFALESPVDGRVQALLIEVNQAVAAGQVVLELEATDIESRLAELEARQNAYEREQINAQALVAALESAVAVAATGQAQRAEATRLALELRQLQLDLANEELERLSQLVESGSVAELTLSKARAAAESARVSLAAEGLERQQLESSAAQADADRLARLAEARRAAEQAQGNLSLIRAEIDTLTLTREQRRVRAPVAGRVVELANLTPGQMVRAGATLGSIVAPGALSIEADFSPASALGRVRLGAPARLSLEGFPEQQFGSLAARVTRVAGEAREGRVRVELELSETPPASGPARSLSLANLEHGLPGSVRVELERQSPLSLLWRTVGGGPGHGG